MISVIICSIDPAELEMVSKNIAATIGVPHEIIGIDNRESGKGICAVYNEGTRLAKFPVLCFMHEDMEMKTANWGAKVLELFGQNEKLGLIGIAGGGYKSLAPSSWYNYYLQENGGFYCNLIQGYKHSGKPDMHDYRNPKSESFSKVACVDGCWFCTKKEIALKYPFDSKLLTKFHGYDLDFSIAISREYEAIVTFNILLKHFSEGNFNKSWMDEILKVHRKWSKVLPVNVDAIPEQHLKRIERDALEVFLQQRVNAEDYPRSEMLKLIWSTRRSRVATFSFPFKLMRKFLKMQKQ
ncbi:glycosyltransferase [Dyadobacter linearis]|nr:glycosyltransferase [Dyadobacter sp. CECT 9623]